MEQILIYFFMGISLSMDAFSLAISLGTTNISKKEILLTSIVIGIFHFFMPLIGNKIGLTISPFLSIKANYIASLIFFLLAIQMYLNRNEEESYINYNLSIILLIALTVSIDSLSVGLAFGLNQNKVMIGSIIFMIISSLFTYIGFNIGKYLSNVYHKASIYIGLIIMILIAIKYLIIG